MASETYNPLPALIDFAQRLRYEDLPANVVHEAKRRVIDSIGTAMGSLSDERLRERRRYFARRKVAYAESGLIFGSKDKLTLPDAAFMNSTMTRWLDINDTYLAKEPAHPSDNLGLLFAMAGFRPLTGKDFITAAALAIDVQCRFTEAASVRAGGWDHVIYINIASALAGAKLLGFDAEQTYNAVSQAINPNVPLRQNREGSYLSEQKNMAAGDAVRGAAWALEKVLAGTTGPAEIFEGKHGVVKQLTGPLEPSAFDGLGQRFYIAETYIKQHMMEYHGQTIVDHAIELRKQLGTPKLDDIASVAIKGYEAHATIIGDESKRTPTTKETADHSLYYAFAAPMLEGQCMLPQYRDELLTDPGIRALIARTTFEEVPEWTKLYYAPSEQREFRSCATVKMRDGRELSHEEGYPHGHPKNPMSDMELEGKFFSLGDDFLLNGRMVLDTFWDLENVNNVADAMSTIVVGGEARL